MNFRQKISCILVFAMLASTSAFAQLLPSFGNSRTGTSGFQFLKIAPDARSASLAGSTSAFTNDLSAVFWNPAGLSSMDSNQYQFQFGHTSYFTGLEMNYAAIGYTKRHLNYWAFSIIYFTTEEMPVTTEFQPEGNGLVFYASNFLATMSFAKVLSDNFSFGLNAKYLEEDIAGIKARNGIFDVGFIYKIGFNGKTKFSANMSNFGFNVSPTGEVTINTLKGPKTYNDFENLSVPAVFRMGLSTVIFQSDLHSLGAAIQLTHPTDNNETVSFGIEYGFKKFLFLRSGYEFGTDMRESPSAGIGLNFQRYFGRIRFDYSFNNRALFGNIHRLTLGIAIK